MAGKQVQEFCSLSAKTYSFDNRERKAKGVNKAAKKKYLTHEHYVKILNEQMDREIECIKIGSKKFRLTTRKETKIGLTYLDKKRIPHPELDKNILEWRDRNHEPYAPGHYMIEGYDE